MVSRAQTADAASKDPTSTSTTSNPVASAPTTAPAWALDMCGPPGTASPHGYGDADSTGALLQQFAAASDADITGVAGTSSTQPSSQQLQNVQHGQTSEHQQGIQTHGGHEHAMHPETGQSLPNHPGANGGQDNIPSGTHASVSRSMPSAVGGSLAQHEQSHLGVSGHSVDTQHQQQSNHGDLGQSRDGLLQQQSGQHVQGSHDHHLSQHNQGGQMQNPEQRSGDQQNMGFAPMSHHSLAMNQKKTSRLPGTKVCPECDSTIAAALAKCSKCTHTFREKKEKVKRSGKRGKKTCPKCGHENPSACSSCKGCSHIFRLKLMDKYRQLRGPRDGNGQDGGSRVNVQAVQHQMQHVAGNPTGAPVMTVGGTTIGASPSHGGAGLGFIPHNAMGQGHVIGQSQPQHLNILHSHSSNVSMAPMTSHQMAHNNMGVSPPSLDAIAAASHRQSVLHQQANHHQQSQSMHLQQHQQMSVGVPGNGDGSHAETGSIVSNDARVV